MDKVIVITGPTGVGKTEFSLQIAKQLNTDIINGDAFQIYKKMDIGTAKIMPIDQMGITHHVLDFLDPKIDFSVADYQKMVRKEIDEMIVNNKIPLIVGGTGLYIDSVIQNYNFNDNARDRDFEDKYSNLSNMELHKYLEKLNPEKASSIHMNNRKRVLRAIEIALTNDSFESNAGVDYYNSLIILLTTSRDVLYERINKRVDIMMKEGLLDEVKSLYPSELGQTAKKAIGYKELFSYLDGDISLEEAIELIKKNSRHYAKRQLTWYRNHPHTKIINIDYNNKENAYNEMIEAINTFLKTN